MCTETYIFFFNKGKKLVSLTVDAAWLVAVVHTVVHLVALLGAVNAGTVATLELIRSAGQQGCKRKAHTHTATQVELDMFILFHLFNSEQHAELDSNPGTFRCNTLDFMFNKDTIGVERKEKCTLSNNVCCHTSICSHIRHESQGRRQRKLWWWTLFNIPTMEAARHCTTFLLTSSSKEKLSSVLI